MSDYKDSTQGLLPPLIDAAAPARYKPVYLSGTGSGNETNAVPFSKDRVHVFSVGQSDVLVGFSRDGNKTNPISTSNGAGMVVPAGSMITFRAFDNGKYGATFVYVTAADGAANFDASVQQRES